MVPWVSTAQSSVVSVGVDPTSLDGPARTAARDTTASLTADVRTVAVVVVEVVEVVRSDDCSSSV